MKSFIKNLSKIVFTNFLIVIFFIILIELFFGYWFEKYNFGPYMREHRMKNQPTTFKYEGKIYTYNYKRNYYGFRGEDVEPSNIDAVIMGGSDIDERYKPDEFTITEYLNKLLKENYYDLKILNAGIEGQTTRGHLYNLLHWFPKIPNFKPKYYIMVDHTGAHYKLITWKDKKILKFDEIPYGIRNLIVNKCMEKNSGKFSFIPKFKALSKTVGDDDKEEEDDKSLYSSKTVLQFYSKSKDDFPGKGSGEKLDESQKDKFVPLSKIPNWRKILSNFHVAPFILDGHRWNGVEWYYHAAKFKKNNPQFSLLFSLDSKSDISTDPVKAKSAGGKTGIYTKKDADGNKEKVVLREPSIKVDGDFFGKNGRGKDEMEAAWEAKFTQNFDAQNVLLKTMNAKLQHFSRGKKPEVWIGLMRLRNKLQNK